MVVLETRRGKIANQKPGSCRTTRRCTICHETGHNRRTCPRITSERYRTTGDLNYSKCSSNLKLKVSCEPSKSPRTKRKALLDSKNKIEYASEKEWRSTNGCNFSKSLSQSKTKVICESSKSQRTQRKNIMDSQLELESRSKKNCEFSKSSSQSKSEEIYESYNNTKIPRENLLNFEQEPKSRSKNESNSSMKSAQSNIKVYSSPKSQRTKRRNALNSKQESKPRSSKSKIKVTCESSKSLKTKRKKVLVSKHELESRSNKESSSSQSSSKSKIKSTESKETKRTNKVDFKQRSKSRSKIDCSFKSKTKVNIELSPSPKSHRMNDCDSSDNPIQPKIKNVCELSLSQRMTQRLLYLTSPTNFSNVRSLKLLFGFGEKKPFFVETKITPLISRINHNFSYFYMNYLMLTAIFFIVALVVSPSVIFWIGGLVILWAIVLKRTSNGAIVIKGLEISQKHASLGLSIISTKLVMDVEILSNFFFWTFYTSATLICSHAILRNHL